MAQPMSGKSSAPLARDNAPVSIFAKEGKAPTGADTVKPTTRRGAVQVALTNAVGNGTVEPLIPATPTAPERTGNVVPPTLAEAPAGPLEGHQDDPGAADLSALVAARKALDEQIKAVKTSQPTQPQRSKLDRVIADQAADPGVWFVRLANRVKARVTAGQPMETAVSEVLEFYRRLLLPPTPPTTE